MPAPENKDTPVNIFSFIACQMESEYKLTEKSSYRRLSFRNSGRRALILRKSLKYVGNRFTL